MRRLIRKGLFAGCTAIFAALCAPASAQEQIDLTFDQARLLGRQAAIQGNVPLALDFANSLLQANPQDFDAWIIRAAATLQGGDAVEGLSAAVAAYRFAPNGIGKYEAARLAALAAANQNRLTLAQWWLRLALVHAPNDAEERQTLTDAAGISRRNPWQTSVRLSFAPSDNVNGGSSDPVYLINDQGIEFLGLEFDYETPLLGQALSGWRGTFDLSTNYTLSQTSTTRNELWARLANQTVRLSQEVRDRLEAEYQEDLAAAEAEVARDPANADDVDFPTRVPVNYFDYSRVDLGYTHTRLIDIGLVSLEVGAFSTWQSGSHSSNGLQAEARLIHNLDDQSRLLAAFGTEALWAAPEQDWLGLRIDASLRYQRAIEGTGTVGVGLSYAGYDAASIDGDYERWTVSASYAPARHLGSARLAFLAGVSFTDFPIYRDYANVEGAALPELIDIPGGRQEERLFGRVTAAFPTYNFAGFYPVISFDAAATSSNVGRFENQSGAIDISFQSSF